MIEQELDDWGIVDPSRPSSFRDPDHTIPNAAVYSSVVRKLMDNAQTDGALFGAGFGWTSPRNFVNEWASWRQYWRQAQRRPYDVRHPINAGVDGVYAAFRAGVPADELYEHPNIAEALVHRLPRVGRFHGRISPKRVRYARIIGHKLGDKIAHNFQPVPINWLRKLSRMPAAVLQAAGTSIWNQRYMEKFLCGVWRKITAVRDQLELLHVPACYWPDVNPIGIAAVVELIRLGLNAKCLPKRIEFGQWDSDLVKLNKSAKKILARGWGSKFVGCVNHEHSSDVRWIAKRLAKSSVCPPSMAWANADVMIEWLDSTGVDARAEVVDPVNRSRDRLAQRNRNWAIQEYGHEYRRGVKLAPMLKQVVEYLRPYSGRIVVHLRDGELISKLLRHCGVRCTEVISSRALTTLATNHDSEYMRYLKRMVRAIHVDTGFVGSIPDWMEDRGLPVERVALVSATSKERQIPITGSVDLRAVVLGDLEHSAQRLAKPTAWGQLAYSFDAPGFWARFYGVIDAWRDDEGQNTTGQNRRR